MNHPATPAPRARKSGAVRRREILAATARLLCAGGPAAVSLERVASDVGIGKTTIYLYFANRESLLEAVSRELLTRCADAAAAAAAQATCPRQATRGFCSALYDSARQLPAELIAGVGVEVDSAAIDQVHGRDFCIRLIDELEPLIGRSCPPAMGARAAAGTVVAAVLTHAHWSGRSAFADDALAGGGAMIADAILSRCA